MLIKNALLKNDDTVLYDIIIEDGKFKQIVLSSENNFQDEDMIDALGKLVIPPFIEPHIHLDTTMSAGQPTYNESGTLFEGIAIWSKRKLDCSIDDVKSRAKQAISMQVGNGIQYIRTHVDITDPSLVALKAMLELKEELKEYVTIQIVAFPQEGIYSYPNGKELIEEALKLGADVIGAIPHFEFTREYGVASIDYIIELALKYNVLIDVHCDEIDDEQSRFVEVLATRALESGLKNKVTASHTTAMGSYNDAYAYKLFRLLRMSNINFIANPLVNIHLQGRFDTYPKRRGMTRVKELNNDNINVCFGHDDIKDPWYPLGTGNMLEVCSMGLHVSQMMGYSQINNALDFITYNSAKTLNLSDYGIKEGNSANFIILNATSGYEAIQKRSEVLYSVRNGKVIVASKPQEKTIFIKELV